MSTALDLTAIHRRTMATLMVAVLPAGAGYAASFAATALLGEDITGSAALGTLAASATTIGGAVAAVPLASLMARRGRRVGLRTAWIVSAVGCLLVLLASVLRFYPLLLVGCLGVGSASTALLAARFAAADLAGEHGRAKSIGGLVWASSFGSVLGPTLGLGVAGVLAARLGLNALAGPFLLGLVTLVTAAVFIDRRLRPDPLHVLEGLLRDTQAAAALAAPDPVVGHGVVLDPHRSVKTAESAPPDPHPLAMILHNPAARLAVIGMLVGHAVMVGVMTATPLHMRAGAHELRLIGIVISVHIIGMYFFAPVVGWLVDRIGPVVVIGAAGIVLFAGAEMASHTRAVDSQGVFIGLFLIGLGWSFGLVAGSTLLTSSVPVAHRVKVQGAADLVMVGAGALASLSAGVVFEFGGYDVLSHAAGLAALVLTVLAAWRLMRRPNNRQPTPVVS